MATEGAQGQTTVSGSRNGSAAGGRKTETSVIDSPSAVMPRFKEEMNNEQRPEQGQREVKPKRQADSMDADLFSCIGARAPSGIIDRVSTVIEQLRRGGHIKPMRAEKGA